MALNLCKAFSIKSNILYVNCLVNNVRNFQSLRLISRSFNHFRHLKLTTLKGNILTTRRSFTLLPCRKNTVEDINLNIVNNVVLFKYENTSYFKKLAFLALGQMLLFFGVSYSLEPLLPKRKKNQPLLNYIMNTKLPIAIIITPIVCGIIGPLLMHMFITRSIIYIILNKGGEKVTVVTHHAFRKSPQITVPLNEVSINKSRKELSKYMSVKLERKPFFYVIHKEGTFVNPELFDNTIGFKKRK